MAIQMVRSEVIAALVNIHNVEIGEANAMADTAVAMTGIWTRNHARTVAINWNNNQGRFYSTTNMTGLI